VALVTSLRDGMNLVSYEYVACQNSKNTEGVLVLSEVSLRLNVLSFPLSADGPKNMLPVF
jgi:trehalose-6-phosphate synthase